MTTLEAPKNPVVKPVTKVEQETVPIINGFTSKQIKEMSLEDLRKIGSSETTSSNAIKMLKGTKEEALKFFESRVVGEIETRVNSGGKVIKIGFDKFGNKLTYRDFSVINGSYPTIELFKGSTGSWVTKIKFQYFIVILFILNKVDNCNFQIIILYSFTFHIHIYKQSKIKIRISILK